MVSLIGVNQINLPIVFNISTEIIVYFRVERGKTVHSLYAYVSTKGSE